MWTVLTDVWAAEYAAPYAAWVQLGVAFAAAALLRALVRGVYAVRPAAWLAPGAAALITSLRADPEWAPIWSQWGRLWPAHSGYHLRVRHPRLGLTVSVMETGTVAVARGDDPVNIIRWEDGDTWVAWFTVRALRAAVRRIVAAETRVWQVADKAQRAAADEQRRRHEQTTQVRNAVVLQAALAGGTPPVA